MKIDPTILVGSLLLLLSTQRPPAPIQESQETPSPTPQVTATPSTAPSVAPATAPSKREAARFAGTWTGRIKFGNAGEVQLTLIINPEATSLIHKSERFGETAHPTTVNAGTLSWTAGVKNGNMWTLTPNPDGQTAVVKVKPLTGGEGAATFQRGESPSKGRRAGAQSKSRP
jgi:hypothetical protein